MKDKFSQTEHRKTILLIATSIFLGILLLGIGGYIVPKDCELIGDDSIGMHTICPNCEDYPQPCLDDMGNLGARIVTGVGLFFILFPLLYPFIHDFQNQRLEKDKLFD